MPEDELAKFGITDENNYELEVDKDTTDGIIIFSQVHPLKLHTRITNNEKA